MGASRGSNFATDYVEVTMRNYYRLFNVYTGRMDYIHLPSGIVLGSLKYN